MFYCLYLSLGEKFKNDIPIVRLINKCKKMLISFLILDVFSRTMTYINQLKIFIGTYQKYCYTAKLFTSIFKYLIKP